VKINKLQRRLFSIFLVAVSWFVLLPATAHAWGSKGHQIIARIARQRLSPRARIAVTELLNGQSLEVVSTWADLQKSSQAFHFVLIPDNSYSYDGAKDCPGGNCLIEKIKYYRGILQDTRQPRLERANALKYLVHLIGDLHQPFHCTDKNGKRANVTFDNKSTTLYAVWESGMIDKSQWSTEQYARALENNEQTSQRALSRGTVVDWALESHALARRAYVDGGDLDKKNYYADYRSILDGQLRKAGVRLAEILNDVFR